MNSYLHSNSKYIPNVMHLNISNFIEAYVIFILFERLLIQLGMPSSIIYILDIINVFFFVVMLTKKNKHQFIGVVISYSIIIISSTIVAFANYMEWHGNPLFTLIELRNIIRFLIFFLTCTSFLNEESYRKIYRILIIFFFINIPCIVYQYFTFHPMGTWTRGDCLNGLFGTTAGGNTFVNVLMLIVIIYLLCRWSNGEISLFSFIIPALFSLLIAALIELKAYFIEFLILYIWYLLKKKKKKKEKIINCIIIFIFLVFSYFVLQIMYKEYPWFRETMSLSGMLASLKGNGYTGTGDLNRFTGIFNIPQRFFNGNILDTLFGIGIGNASAFTIDGIGTKFYNLHQNSHYNWFSATFIFTQCGVIGLALYLYTFVNLLIKKKKECLFKLNSQIVCIIALFLVFYGEALKTDVGYLVYFALASGFVQLKKTNNRIKNIKV